MIQDLRHNLLGVGLGSPPFFHTFLHSLIPAAKGEAMTPAPTPLSDDEKLDAVAREWCAKFIESPPESYHVAPLAALLKNRAISRNGERIDPNDFIIDAQAAAPDHGVPLKELTAVETATVAIAMISARDVEIARLRTALTFYAQSDVWDAHRAWNEEINDWDNGDIARAALKWEATK